MPRPSLVALLPFKTLKWKVPSYQNQPEKKAVVEQKCHEWYDTNETNFKRRGITTGVIRYISLCPSHVSGAAHKSSSDQTFHATLEMYDEDGKYVTKHHVQIPEE